MTDPIPEPLAVDVQTGPEPTSPVHRALSTRKTPAGSILRGFLWARVPTVNAYSRATSPSGVRPE